MRFNDIVVLGLGVTTVRAFPVLAQDKAATTMHQQTIWKFDFGQDKATKRGHQTITPDTVYDTTRGYGFEPGARVVAQDGYCTSEHPFSFSVALPEGNYAVTVHLGGAKTGADTVTTVKAEQRRLMLERVVVPPGKSVSRTFVVNIRTPAIPGSGPVRLKDREKAVEGINWDEKLTLQFSDARPSIQSVEITPVSVPTVFLLGDSTVCDQPREPYNSWGQMLPRFFGPGVAVANHAQSGDSLRSAMGARRLDKVVSQMRAGDFLLIQYGHNDMKAKGEGIGAFTSYKTDLKRFVAAARAKGGQPIIVTSVQRRRFDENGKIVNTFGDYIEAARQTAREEKVPLIDLNALSAPFYEALGPAESPKAFAPGDNTHHNDYGSYEIAKCVVEGIRTGVPALARFLAPDVKPFDPAHPDPVTAFILPPDPTSEGKKPDGS